MPRNFTKSLKSVLVGVSGGIDSSAALLLLKKQGFKVEALYLQMAQSDLDGNYKKAQKAAALLGIQLIRKNIAKEFKKRIINYFIEAYKKNKTPNPCVICNQEIKFKFLKEEAQKRKIDFIATGHYARIKKDQAGWYYIMKARDKNKDQSYFLYRLKSSDLEKTIFPLGEQTKEKTRETIRKSILNKINFEKESQDVCFANDEKRIDEFLKRKITKPYKGDIVDENGRKLGRHKGLEFYTKGQRKGLNLTGGPFYVISKNKKKGELVVSKDKNHPALRNQKIIIEKIIWAGATPITGKEYQFKSRYQGKPGKGIIRKNRGGWKAVLKNFQWAVAEGQSLVVYDGQKVVGGGIIKEVKSFSLKLNKKYGRKRSRNKKS